jgi:dienelactone hydrolase
MWRSVAFLILTLLPAAASEMPRFDTTVLPLANEDVASGCHLAITIAAPEHPVDAVWVIYDRGRDVHDLYSDPSVVTFARRSRLALLLHGHCPGKKPEDHGDMNMDPANGLGRVLFAGLAQFAEISGHRELANAKVFLLGFSGAGSLSARMVSFAPSRVVAAILSSPGHYEPMGIDTVLLNHGDWTVPELILAGGRDDVSGTSRPYAYFQKYRDLGAPWLFVVQNNSPHCCTANAKNLILLWLTAIIQQRRPLSSNAPLAGIDQQRGWLGFFRTQPTDTRDSFGLSTFNVVSAAVEKTRRGLTDGWQEAGWLPNHTVAQEWLMFEQQQQHPILPLR